MPEEWKPMVNHPRFLVSSEGRISDKNGKIYALWKNREGYMQVCLSENGKKFIAKPHLEMARAFLPKPFENAVVNHIDGVKTHNTLSNLEWCSMRENVKHALRLGFFKPPEPFKRRVVCIETGKEYESACAAARDISAPSHYGTHILSCCSGSRKTCRGFHWRYAEEGRGEHEKQEQHRQEGQRVPQATASGNG